MAKGVDDVTCKGTRSGTDLALLVADAPAVADRAHARRAGRHILSIGKIMSLDPEEALTLAAEVRGDAGVSNDMYRRLLRQGGYRGLEKIGRGAALTAALQGFDDSLDMATMRDERGNPITDDQGRPLLLPEREQALRGLVHQAVGDRYQTEDPPRVLVMAGGPGSGKTSAREQSGLAPAGAAALDCDELQKGLPDYERFMSLGDPAAAFVLYREKKELQRLVFDAIMERRVNFVLDSTGNQPPGTFAGQLRELHEAGYRVDVVYVNTDAHTAIDRACSRGRADGRWMTDEVVAAWHGKVAARFGEIAELDFLHTLQVYDNNGAEAKLIAERPAGSKDLRVDHDGDMDRFLAKAAGADDPSVILGYGEHELGPSL